MAIWVCVTCNRDALRWLIGFIGMTERKVWEALVDLLATFRLLVRMEKLNGGCYRFVFNYLVVA